MRTPATPIRAGQSRSFVVWHTAYPLMNVIPGAGISGHVLTDEERRRGLGRVQRKVRRALLAGGQRTSDLMEWAYPGKRKRWHCWAVHRAAQRVAVVFARDRKGVI
jgi:hypothetical protein